jgi:hypothetical protein
MKDNRLKASDWVEVRSKEEILGTLDEKGQLDGLPFMPEMFQFCGRKLQVFKRAHKTCDTVNPVRGRRMTSAVHLQTRCDGQAHGGCQAACMLFWKEAWLKPVQNDSKATAPAAACCASSTVKKSCRGCSEQTVWDNTRVSEGQGDTEPRYSCQATRLPDYTHDLNWWDIRQYIEDYRSGNIHLGAMLRGFVYAPYFTLIQAGIGLGRPLRWLYDVFNPLWGGLPYPRHTGLLRSGERTPHAVLNLQPGELVRVKPYKEILATLDSNNKNRGLYFDAEAVPFCGGTYRVRARVSKIIDEKTGKMTPMKTESIILEGVYCQARYSECRMFCPRAIYPYWREIWLERVLPTNMDAVPNSKTSEAVTTWT